MAEEFAVARAARRGEVWILEDLLRSGHDYSGKDSSKFTPLHEAAKAGHLDCVKLLLEYAQKDLPNKLEFLSCVCSLDGGFDTPLSIAASNGCWPVVEHLAELYEGTTAFETGYALWKACESDHTKCVEVLLQKFPRHAEESWDWGEVKLDEYEGRLNEEYFPIHLSVRNRNPETTKLLLQFGANVNQRTLEYNKTPLHFAASTGCAEVIKILLMHGADPTAKDHYLQTPLHAAAEFSFFECLQLILEAIRKRTGESCLAQYVLQPSQCKSTPLSLAVDIGDSDVVSVLLEEALTIDPWSDEKAVSDYGTDTAFLLHTACETNCIDVIDLLVQKLPQLINKPDHSGDFPIHVAARCCSEDVLKLLVEAGADVDVKSRIYGRTVLHSACLNNHHDAIPYLIRVVRHNINTVCEEGLSPLQAAAVCSNLDAIKTLLAYGADLMTGPSKYCSYALLVCVAHIENINIVSEEELQKHGPEAVLHAAVCHALSDSSSECLEYMLMNGIPTFSAHAFSESFRPVDEDPDDDFPRFLWDMLINMHPDSIFRGKWFSTEENNISGTIKILLEYETPFCDWAKARREIEAEYVFGDWHTSKHPHIHKCNLEMFLNYGMAELQYDCQSFPAIRKLSESQDKLKNKYIGTDDVGYGPADALRRMEMYMEYFPFAKFSNAEERMVPGIKFLNGSVVQSVPALVEVCRWNIRCCFVRKHGVVCMKHLKALPLPKRLKNFLSHQIIE